MLFVKEEQKEHLVEDFRTNVEQNLYAGDARSNKEPSRNDREWGKSTA